MTYFLVDSYLLFLLPLFPPNFSTLCLLTVSGLVKEDGSLNWSCPCLGGMATGPCGVEFREAFQCFHYSEADPKGSDCLEPFREMSKCMSEFPGVYGNKEDNVMNVNDDDDNEDSKEAPSSSSDSTVGKVESSSSESDDASSSKSDNSSNDKSSSKS